jgi:signal transduction histidine kinase
MVGKTSAEACAARGYSADVAAERDRRFAQALREHREVTWEETVPGPTGLRHWLRRIRPVFGPDGNFRLMVASGLDTTEHRRAEDRVREQQALTQHLLDSVPNPIRLTTADGRLLFRNAAQVDIARYTARRQRLFAQHPGQVPELQLTQARLQHVLATGQEAVFDIAFHLDSGEVRDYQVVMRPLQQPDGTTHVLTVSTDITDLKQAQRGATQAAEAQESFLATMSHEIRTPLNGVLGMAGLLAKTPLNPEQQRYLDVVQHSGRYLLAILNDVLDMAKIRAGQLQLETVPVDLHQALHLAAQTLAWQAHSKGLALTMAVFEQPPPVVQTDPVRLNQVLLNLLSNAIKFTESGQITLHAAVRNETAEALTVHFSVHDTGPGLSPEVQEHVFDAFAQASSDTTRRYGGTGLGLAISSLLVEQLGGHLVVCSEPDYGSTGAAQSATGAPPPSGSPARCHGFARLACAARRRQRPKPGVGHRRAPAKRRAGRCCRKRAGRAGTVCRPLLPRRTDGRAHARHERTGSHRPHSPTPRPSPRRHSRAGHDGRRFLRAARPLPRRRHERHRDEALHRKRAAEQAAGSCNRPTHLASRAQQGPAPGWGGAFTWPAEVPGAKPVRARPAVRRRCALCGAPRTPPPLPAPAAAPRWQPATRHCPPRRLWAQT